MSRAETRRESTTRSFFRRALIAAGVTQVLSSPHEGYVFALPGNGKVAVTGSVYWHQIMKKWREEDDPAVGWRGVAFREPTTRRSCVMMSTQSLGRILADLEQLSREAGRPYGQDQ